MKRLSHILRTLRIAECIPFCGVALLGALMRLPPELPHAWVSIGIAVVAAFLLTAFVFSFNDIQDLETDRRSGCKASRPLASGTLSKSAAWATSVGAAAIAVLLLAVWKPWPLFAVAGCAIAMGVGYSLKGVSLKTIPVISSLVHIAYATCIYTLGAWSVSVAEPGSLLVGGYFGLVFAAGHLNHEVIDAEPDHRAGVRTHAVLFGTGLAVWASFATFCLSAVYFSLLAIWGWIAGVLGWIQGGMFTGYIVCFLALRGQGEPARLRRLQLAYRVVYLAGGLAMVVVLLLKGGG
jgi:4-hydroxybenzoate polyprenyltransferase